MVGKVVLLGALTIAVAGATGLIPPVVMAYVALMLVLWERNRGR